MATGMIPAKRFIVRTALVAGSTLATIIGAQNLILLDSVSHSTPITSIVSTASNVTTNDVTTVDSTVSILRQASSNTVSSNTVAVVPTAQSIPTTTVPSIPTTRSSR